MDILPIHSPWGKLLASNSAYYFLFISTSEHLWYWLVLERRKSYTAWKYGTTLVARLFFSSLFHPNGSGPVGRRISGTALLDAGRSSPPGPPCEPTYPLRITLCRYTFLGRVRTFVYTISKPTVPASNTQSDRSAGEYLPHYIALIFTRPDCCCWSPEPLLSSAWPVAYSLHVRWNVCIFFYNVTSI
jgi:hypothetical protein